jgi:hypothetical protein
MYSLFYKEPVFYLDSKNQSAYICNEFGFSASMRRIKREAGVIPALSP